MKEEEMSIFSPPFPLLPLFRRGKNWVEYSNALDPIAMMTRVHFWPRVAIATELVHWRVLDPRQVRSKHTLNGCKGGKALHLPPTNIKA